jgi:microcystin degradation protein MlrC
VADVGAKLWVIADGSASLAQQTAQELGELFFGLRHATRPAVMALDEAMQTIRAAGTGTTFVLADIADNAGGGAPGDSTFMLQALLQHGVGNAALAAIWDPMAVAMCCDAGVGAVLTLRIGGKCSPESGVPLDLEVQVRALSRHYAQTGLIGTPESLGACAWVHCRGIDIVLSSLRNQVFNRDVFTNFGIPVEQRRVLVVKSSQHFYTSFAPLADQVLYVQTAGGLGDVRSIAYTKRDARFWPRIDNPFTD